MTLIVRPVRRTPHLAEWVSSVEALGGVVTGRDGDRVDLALGYGRVAVVRADVSGAELAGAAGVLSRLGLTVRIASHKGDWVDFAAPEGGLVAAHGADRPSVQLSFEYDGDVRALAARLTARGLTASVVDENYGLTVRVPDPDGIGDIWVNEVQTDLHGYRRAGT